MSDRGRALRLALNANPQGPRETVGDWVGRVSRTRVAPVNLYED